MKYECTNTTISLGELLEQPPTVVIYRPDGQLSLDMLPGMTTPDAVVCFRRWTRLGGSWPRAGGCAASR